MTSFDQLNDFQQFRIRAQVRWQLRRKKRFASSDERRNLDLFLKDSLLLDELCAESFAHFSVADSDSPILDNILKFFNWFIENWEAIEKIIGVIIGLFGANSHDVEAIELCEELAA